MKVMKNDREGRAKVVRTTIDEEEEEMNWNRRVPLGEGETHGWKTEGKKRRRVRKGRRIRWKRGREKNRDQQWIRLTWIPKREVSIERKKGRRKQSKMSQDLMRKTLLGHERIGGGGAQSPLFSEKRFFFVFFCRRGLDM